jgi:regulatory protein
VSGPLAPKSRSDVDSALDSALDWALGALGRRDLSAAELERRLADKGFSDDERDEALATLRRTGLVDDGRYAGTRALSLAARGAGDALIRHDLECSGVAPEAVAGALAELEAEDVRARRIVDRRGEGPKTLRYLAAKGFSEDAIELSGGGRGGDCW